MKLKLLLFSTLLINFSACSDAETLPQQGGEEEEPDTPSASVEKTVTINAGQTFQTIKGFAASDCWTPAFVGKYWTNNRNEIAELLFSSEITDGQPKGIGLSMWRVNMGGGSMEQGDESGISNVSRRAESYLNDDLTLDWTRCEGQRYFMEQAKELGCDQFVLFSNTPPVQYTKNGKGFSSEGNQSNLKEDCYDDFAAYMADVAAHYTSEGYNITHISPINEPQFSWNDGGQEGSPWTNDEAAHLLRELDNALTERGLSTDILPGEAAEWTYLYTTKDDPNRSKVIEAFFEPSSSAYIGDLTHVKNLIGGHSYWTDGTWDGMRNARERMAQTAGQYGLEVWQTEWSMLGDNYSSTEFGSYDTATTMDIALYMSRVIHNDLTVAGVTSWSYWTSMDISQWGQKDRFLLISLIPNGWTGDGGDTGLLRNGGSYQAMPTLWVLGNYSRFIRPGYRRIAMELSESMNFFGSAWISPEADEIVAVYTNYSDKGVRLNETREGWNGDVASITTYTTTQDKNLEEKNYATDEKVILDAESVTTVVYTLK